MIKKQMIGSKYGHLTVLDEYIERNKNGHIKYVCECDCGNIKNIFGTHLREGKTISCGCETKNRVTNGNSGRFSGVTGEQWYSIIKSGIKTRVKRSNLEISITKKYVNDLFIEQGGKCKLSGLEITLPKKWNDRSYTASLDRIDSSIGYIEGNVQWVHKHINVIKNIFPQDIFIYLCNRVSDIHVSNIDSEYLNGFRWGVNQKYLR